MTMAEVDRRSSRALPSAAAAPVRTHTTVTSVTPDRRRATRSRPTTASFRCRTRGAGERRLQPPERAGASSRPCRRPIECFTPLDYRNPDQLPDRRRAGRRRVRHRRAAGRRNPPLGPARDALGRRARAAAADLSRPRRAVVDGRLRRLEPALRRDRRPDARAEAAVAAAGRHAGAHDARPQRPQRGRRRDRRPAGRRARRPGALFGRTAQSVRAGRSEDGSAARHVRRLGAQPRDAMPTSARRSASSRPARRPRRDSISTSRAARSVPSSGRPGFARTTAGSTFRSSIAKGTCGTTAASSMRRGCMRSACPCSGAASRRSSMAPRTTRATSSLTWRDICRSRPSPIVRSLPAWRTPRCARRPGTPAPRSSRSAVRATR